MERQFQSVVTARLQFVAQATVEFFRYVIEFSCNIRAVKVLKLASIYFLRVHWGNPGVVPAHRQEVDRWMKVYLLIIFKALPLG